MNLTHLQVEVKENDHFAVARLEEGVLDVVVQNVHFVASHRRVTEPIGVRLEPTGHSLGHDVGPDVEILQLGVALVLRQYQRVLLNQVLLLALLGLAALELLLHLLDQPEGGVQVRRRGGNFTWLFGIRASVGPVGKIKFSLIFFKFFVQVEI